MTDYTENNTSDAPTVPTLAGETPERLPQVPPLPYSDNATVEPPTLGANAAPPANNAPPAAPAQQIVPRQMVMASMLGMSVVPPDVADPSTARAGRTLAQAAFETHNVVASTIASEALRERLFPSDTRPMTTDDLIAALDRDQLWGIEDHFLEVRTVGQYTAMRAQLARETDNQQRLRDANLFASVPLALSAALFDLPTLIPAWRLAQGVRLGSAVLRTGIQTSVGAGVGTAISEAALHATQELRTVDESLYAVGGATLLGFVLGGGVASIARGDLGRIALRTQETWQGWLRGGETFNQRIVSEAEQAWEGLNQQVADRIAAGRKPTKKMLAQQTDAFDALTAAQDRLALYNDLGMARAGPLEWARAIGPRIAGTFSARWLDPHDFIFKRSNSAVARQAMEQLMEVPVLLNKNLRGDATALAASTELDTFVGGWAVLRDKMLGGSVREELARKASLGNSYYAQARKAGFNGNFRDFDAAVDTAVRSGYADPNGNSGVTSAAQELKRLIIDPVAKEARAAGIELPDNPMGALGYAPRKYRVDRVIGADGQGTIFKQTVAKHQLDRLIEQAKANNEPLTPQKVSGLRRSARNFAHESYQSIIRGRVDEENAFSGAFLSGGSPFSARVVPVPDAVLIENGWLEQSVTSLMDIYLRQTVPTILMAKRFKTGAGKADPSLEQSVIPAIVREYDQLGKVATSAAEREAISAEGSQVVAMVRNMRDAMLHTDRFNPRTRWHDHLNNAIQLTKLYQVTRLMGNIGLASLPDVANIITRAGPGRFAKTVGDSVMKAARLEGINGAEAASEAKRLGAAVEWATNSSAAAMADLMSPLQGASTPVSRFVHNTARVYSISNFSVHWNDTMRRAVYRTSVDRILEGSERGWASLPQAEQTFLAHLGLDKEKVNRIGAAWRSQNDPLHDGFLRWASVTDWSDAEAARYMAGALNKDVASTVIRPRTGDKALGFSGPLASLVFQFQGFLQSHALRTLTMAEQRIMANGPFSGDALRVYTGAGVAVSLGWMAELLYALARDAVLPDDKKKHVRQLQENPGTHISRAVDRSALTGLFGQGNVFWERFGGTGQTRALQSAFDDKTRQIPEARARFAERDPLQALLGPSLSQVSDIIRFGVHANKSAIDGRPFVKRDARTLREAAPWQNHIVLRGLFDTAERELARNVLHIPSHMLQ